jgi:hypothetical protein
MNKLKWWADEFCRINKNETPPHRCQRRNRERLLGWAAERPQLWCQKCSVQPVLKNEFEQMTNDECPEFDFDQFGSNDGDFDWEEE